MSSGLTTPLASSSPPSEFPPQSVGGSVQTPRRFVDGSAALFGGYPEQAPKRLPKDLNVKEQKSYAAEPTACVFAWIADIQIDHSIGASFGRYLNTLPAAPVTF